MKKLLLILLGLSIVGSAQADRTVSILNNGAYNQMHLTVTYELGGESRTSSAMATMGLKKVATFPDIARSINVRVTGDGTEKLNVTYPDRETRELAVEIHGLGDYPFVTFCGLRGVVGWGLATNNCLMTQTHAVSIFNDSDFYPAVLKVSYTMGNGIRKNQSVTAYKGSTEMVQIPQGATSINVKANYNEQGGFNFLDVVYPDWESRLLKIQSLEDKDGGKRCAYEGQAWTTPKEGCGLN